MTTPAPSGILKIKPTIVGANEHNQLPANKDFTISLEPSSDATFKSVRFVLLIDGKQLEPANAVALSPDKPTEQRVKFPQRDIKLDTEVVIEPRFYTDPKGSDGLQKGTNSDAYTFNAKQLD